jgi:hypothetical protein
MSLCSRRRRPFQLCLYHQRLGTTSRDDGAGGDNKLRGDDPAAPDDTSSPCHAAGLCGCTTLGGFGSDEKSSTTKPRIRPILW